MIEYTPTTQEIKEFAAEMLGWDIADPDAAFDRWLDEERRAAAEKAWDEGRSFGYKDAQEHHAFGNGCGPDEWDCDCPNPYRAKEVAPDGR